MLAVTGIGQVAKDLINPDLPANALSSKQFNTIVELLGEGEIEGSATASKAGITEVIFDRNGYLYHGRIKALADSAREAGLKF